MGEWYSVKEAAGIVKVSEDTILRAIHEKPGRKQLKASRVRKRWRIAQPDLKAYLTANCNVKQGARA